MDRLALPNDRCHSCPACGSEKREYLTTCMVCEADICSECRIEERADVWSTLTIDLCRDCATRELNAQLAPLVPVCTCEYPAWSHYGQQFSLEVA